MTASQIRKQIHKQRQQLSKDLQQQASIAVFHQFKTAELLNNKQHIACYFANSGEIDPHSIIELIWEQNKNCYLPVLNQAADNGLLFLPYTTNSKLIPNKYGICEPIADKPMVTQALDMVLVPLVAFDKYGHRIGMGAGFYDKTFAFCLGSNKNKPYLVGLAHSFQEVDEIIPNSWDVPLDAVITPESRLFFS